MFRALSKIPLHWQTLAAMALGAVLGSLFGTAMAPLGKLGSALIQIIKALATPLLFFVLLDSFMNSAIHGRALLRLVIICGINAVFAVTIGMTVAGVLQPGLALRGILPSGAAPTAPKGDMWTWILGYLPENLFQPFITHSVPGAILLAILFGLALQSMQKEGEKIGSVKKGVAFAVQLLLHAIGWVVKLSPLAVLGVVAQSVGDRGLAPLLGLVSYTGATILGMALQAILVYQVWIVFSRVRLADFWRAAKEPMLYSFGVNSSLATLPLTLKALERLKVSPAAARLGAGLGTNFNNDGILLYEAAAVLIVTQAYGMELSVGAQIALMVSCAITTFGVAGVPEAGIIALTLVLSSAGIPTEILPLLLTVDWIVARCRSATNVLGDMTTSIALDKRRAAV